jgi:hypothetical protein
VIGGCLNVPVSMEWRRLDCEDTAAKSSAAVVSYGIMALSVNRDVPGVALTAFVVAVALC